MQKPTLERVSPSEIREVAAFVRAQTELAEWKTRHPKAATELAELAERYNALLEAADTMVRLRKVGCGPFVLSELRPKYDAEALYKAAGRQRFAALGGTMKTVEDRKVEGVIFEAAVLDGRVETSLVEKVVTYGPRFRTVERIELP